MSPSDATSGGSASDAILRDGVRALVDSIGDMAGRDDEWLETVLSDAESAVNILQAAQAEAMLALEAHARAIDATLPVSVAHLANRREEGVVDQIAVSLRCTKPAASYRYETARAAHHHQPLIAAWRTGQVDQRKVAVIADALGGSEGANSPTVPHDIAQQLAADAVVHAASHTAPQTKSWLTRRVIAFAPEVARQRHERASANRSVTLHPTCDDMAELVAYLPAIQARQAFDTLTAAAHTMDAPDERRTIGQRRADSLVDLLCGRQNPPQVNVNVTVDSDTLMGLASHPVELAGFGPVTAGAARRFLARQDPVYRRLITGTTGVVTAIDPQRYRPSPGLEQFIRIRDLTCRFPGCRRPTMTTRNGVDLDHTEPWPAGSTTPDNLAALCRHHHRVKHSPGWQLQQEGDGILTWTTPGGRRIRTEPWSYESAADPPPY